MLASLVVVTDGDGGVNGERVTAVTVTAIDGQQRSMKSLAKLAS